MRRVGALGVCDLLYYTTAITIINEIVKSTFAVYAHMEENLGGKMVTVIFEGDIQDVEEALKLTQTICENQFPNHCKNLVMVTNPHAEILKFIRK